MGAYFFKEGGFTMQKNIFLTLIFIILIVMSLNTAIEAKPIFYEPAAETDNYDLIYAYIEYVEGFRYLDDTSTAILLNKNESTKELLKYLFN